MDAVLYADDDEDDDADFRFTVMVKEAEIVAELAERIFGASHPLAKDAQKVLGRGPHTVGTVGIIAGRSYRRDMPCSLPPF